MRLRPLPGALLTAVAVAVAGCGLIPGSAPRRSAAAARSVGAETAAAHSAARRTRAAQTAAGRLAQAQRTGEYPKPAGAQTVPGGWRSPAQAVSVFAATYINWTAATVSLRLRALALVSVGQARSAMTLAAAQTAGDYELHRGGIANSGTVESVAPMPGRPRQYVVVTREQTTATNTSAYRGLEPVWHVSLATVTRVLGDLWVLSAWQPES
jgi:hypothetical protein